jgi:EpsI family protein
MIRFSITIFLFFATAVANYSFSRPEAEISRRPLREFPKEINGWRMVDEQKIDEESMAVLQVDDYIMRTYVNAAGDAMGLYVGYFKSQTEGKQVHSPRQCLPGSGWSIIERSEISVPLRTDTPGRAEINSFLMGRGAERDLFLWWYQGRGRVYSNEYLNKAYLMWDRLRRGRTDGALVRVNSRVNPNADQTLQELTAFINIMMPQLPRYIPD